MKQITEGRARILVPEASTFRNSEVFYNPEMAGQRDLAVSFLQVWQKAKAEPLSVCDPLAGSGVRATRMLLEVDGIEKVVINDLNPQATKLIGKNLGLCGIPENRYELCNRDANILMLGSRSAFDYVDIDPFGSPVFYLDAAAAALKKDALLACTAMDTGALAGSFPSTCMRRYCIRNTRTDFLKEMGVRVLVTAIIKCMARHDIGFSPLISQHGHFFRVVGRVRRSGGMAGRSVEKIRMTSWCRSCLWRAVETVEKCPNCESNIMHLGPLWTGPLHDREFCAKTLEEYKSRGFGNSIARTLEAMVQESDFPFYYDIHKVYKKMKACPMSLESVIEKLKGNGFSACRTHLCPTGIRTDAGIADINKTIRS
jgi:tRNA (guanine26-N2/guanine27-N2)-dimethyltransferase